MPIVVSKILLVRQLHVVMISMQWRLEYTFWKAVRQSDGIDLSKPLLDSTLYGVIMLQRECVYRFAKSRSTAVSQLYTTQDRIHIWDAIYSFNIYTQSLCAKLYNVGVPYICSEYSPPFHLPP